MKTSAPVINETEELAKKNAREGENTMSNGQEPKYYMATFRPAFRTSDLVYPIQFGILAVTRKGSKRESKDENRGGGKSREAWGHWRTGSLRLKELADKK
ncbi:MAG: hypothetical protein IPL59_15000, partial [Candidatus Competibacteraceae bacterium]|nr:hypothetical protein [Candidatus Competibacteraceae bacterium]